MTAKTKAAAKETPAAEQAEGLQVFDNTEASTKEAPKASVSEEYELTEGLVQVNYV